MPSGVFLDTILNHTLASLVSGGLSATLFTADLVAPAFDSAAPLYGVGGFAAHEVKPGRTITDGTVTAGSQSITSTTAAFVADDVGQGLVGSEWPAGTKIQAVTSGTAATASAAALSSTSTGAWTIGGDGYTTGGQALGSPAAGVAGGLLVVTADSVVWIGSTILARYVLISATTGDYALYLIDFGSDQQTVMSAWQVNFPARTVIALTP